MIDRYPPNSEEIRKQMEPGYAVHAERQTGKTTSIIATVHLEHRGRAIIVAMNQEIAERIQRSYHEAFPQDEKPRIVGPLKAVDAIRGIDLPVYVDEWWLLPTKVQRELRDSGRVAGAVGTVPHIAKIRL